MYFNEVIHRILKKTYNYPPHFIKKSKETWTILGVFLYLQTVLFLGDIT